MDLGAYAQIDNISAIAAANGIHDTDCPIDWNGKEYCNFGEKENG